MSLLANFLLAANARTSNCGTENGFLPGLYDGLCSNGQVAVESAADIFVIVGNVVRILIAASGALAVIMIIVGGIWYVTSHGDPERVRRAKAILTKSITGLIVILVSYTVVTFIATKF